MSKPICNNSSKMGVFSTICLVAGNMIGSGVLMLPAALSLYGKYSFIGWFITCLGALSLGFVFTKLSSWIPESGGPLVFAKKVFGDFIGFQVAWCYWLFSCISNVVLVVTGIAYMSLRYDNFSQTEQMMIGLIMIWGFTAINMISIKCFEKVQILITILKIIPIILFVICGAFYFDLSTLSSLNSIETPWNSVSKTVALTLWGFVGIESATIPSSEVRHPSKVIPIAITVGVLITAAIYVIGSATIMSTLDQQVLSDSKAPFVDATLKIFGEPYATLMLIFGVITIVGTLNGWVMIQGYLPKSAADCNIFPKIFQITNRAGLPFVSLLIGGIVMTVTFLLNYTKSALEQFNFIVEVSCFMVVIPYIYSISSALILAFTDYRDTFKSKMNFGLFVIALMISFGYVIYAVVGIQKEIIVDTMIFIFLSIFVYCFVLKR